MKRLDVWPGHEDWPIGALGFSWRDDAEIDRRLDAVTPAQVQAAARRYLTDDRLTVAVLAAQATPPGQRQRRP